MWKFRDFTHRRAEINGFEIMSYSATDSYDACKAVMYCQTDVGARWAAKTLFEIAHLAITGTNPRFEFNIQTKKYKNPGPKFNSIEVSAVMGFTPDALVAAIIRMGGAPPLESLDIKPGALSVGPCAYEDALGIFIKVRFNGYSVPFYFNSEKFLAEPTKTEIIRTVGSAYAGAIMKVLQDNEKTLYKRATTKALNLSKIDDYAEHNIKIMKGDGKGKYFSADVNEIADPNAELITLFSYGYDDTFALINDEVYRVNGIISGYSLNYLNQSEDQCFTPALYNLDYDSGQRVYKGYLRRKDCVLLDPRDQYVRQKIGRSVKAKL